MHTLDQDVTDTALYVLVRDPSTGELGYLCAVPAIVPSSETRFARGRSLPMHNVARGAVIAVLLCRAPRSARRSRS
jgi:hypothetical protein